MALPPGGLNLGFVNLGVIGLPSYCLRYKGEGQPQQPHLIPGSLHRPWLLPRPSTSPIGSGSGGRRSAHRRRYSRPIAAWLCPGQPGCLRDRCYRYRTRV